MHLGEIFTLFTVGGNIPGNVSSGGQNPSEPPGTWAPADRELRPLKTVYSNREESVQGVSHSKWISKKCTFEEGPGQFYGKFLIVKSLLKHFNSLEEFQ